MKAVAIVNPVSGMGRSPAEWPELVRSKGVPADRLVTWWTEGPGHAEELAARARREGFDRVVVVGGDGTLLEVVNGIWWEPQGQQPSLGVVPFGTGCDYRRNFDLGAGLPHHLATALGHSVVLVDAGVCRLRGFDGNPRKRTFLMAVGAGFDADVLDRFRKQRSFGLGKTSYAISVLRQLAGMKKYCMEGVADEEPFSGHGILCVAALGRYFGGGMMVAPDASPLAGRFQIIRGNPSGPLHVLALLFKMYSGSHVGDSRVQSHYARRFRLSTDPPAFVQAEGEIIGKTPVEIEHVSRAFLFAARSAL